MKSCPTTVDLEDFLDGSVSAAERPQLQQHIENCLRCQQRLEHLTSDPEWMRLLSPYNQTAKPAVDIGSTAGLLALPGYSIKEN